MATTSKTTEKVTNPGDELVPVYLFRDGGRYKDDVFVAVNGERVQIKRGERVEVKKKFADVLQQSMEQDNKTASLIDSKESEYNRHVNAGKL